jgi:hypothetical protein
MCSMSANRETPDFQEAVNIKQVATVLEDKLFASLENGAMGSALSYSTELGAIGDRLLQGDPMRLIAILNRQGRHLGPPCSSKTSRFPR